jgi:hypothetical protein
MAKKSAESPHPSGTALVSTTGGLLGLTYANPATGIATTIGSGILAKLLNSPKAVEILTKGLRVPKSGAERAFNAAQIQSLVNREKAKEKK